MEIVLVIFLIINYFLLWIIEYTNNLCTNNTILGLGLLENSTSLLPKNSNFNKMWGMVLSDNNSVNIIEIEITGNI